MKSILFIVSILVGFATINANACQVSPCPGQPGWGRTLPQRPAPTATESRVETAATEDGSLVVIRGAAADELYKTMKDIRASNKTKVGAQVSCNKLRVETQCTLEVGSRGQVFDNE